MTRFSRLCLAMLGLGIPAAAAQTSVLPPQPIAIQGAMTHVYKSIGGVELRLHAFNPPNHNVSMRRPAILLFFGGGWTNGTVEQFVPQAKHLAQRGMVAIVADYRVFGRHNTSPFEAMADARSAVRWVRSHATALGIDPNRIAAGGGSAGGHIALSAAVFDTALEERGENTRISARPDLLVLFNPAVDTTSERQKERFAGRGRDASPLHHIRAGLPPMVIVHGKADTTVPYADVERLCNAIGAGCHLIGYEGATHGFFNGKWHQQTLLEVDRFLTKNGYLSEPASTAGRQ